MFDSVFRRSFLHVQSVVPANVEEAYINRGTEECSAEPWSGVKWPAEAGVGYFAKCGEG